MRSVSAFGLTTESKEDLMHLAATSPRELVLRLALATARERFTANLNRWKEHQIELELWMDPERPAATPELEALRMNLAAAYIQVPWVFCALVRRAMIGRKIEFVDMDGFSMKMHFDENARAALFNAWSQAIMVDVSMPKPVSTFLYAARLNSGYGIPYAAGASLTLSISIANEIVGQAELDAAGVETAHNAEEYLPV